MSERKLKLKTFQPASSEVVRRADTVVRDGREIEPFCHSQPVSKSKTRGGRDQEEKCHSPC